MPIDALISRRQFTRVLAGGAAALALGSPAGLLAAAGDKWLWEASKFTVVVPGRLVFEVSLPFDTQDIVINSPSRPAGPEQPWQLLTTTFHGRRIEDVQHAVRTTHASLDGLMDDSVFVLEARKVEPRKRYVIDAPWLRRWIDLPSSHPGLVPASRLRWLMNAQGVYGVRSMAA